MRLLLVEDERDLNRILTRRLREEGYSVDSCLDGDDAWDHISLSEYDVIIMDIMLPGTDGLEILKRMRAKKNSTPLLFLTARDSIGDRVLGLDLGANDYLVKPFSTEELLARIRALIRVFYHLESSVIRADDLELDTATRTVKRAGNVIELSQKEYALLEYLMLNRNIILSREKIEEHVWDIDYEGGTNVVDVYISYLRKKIDSAHERKLINTIRGRGYCIRA